MAFTFPLGLQNFISTLIGQHIQQQVQKSAPTYHSPTTTILGNPIGTPMHATIPEIQPSQDQPTFLRSAIQSHLT